MIEINEIKQVNSKVPPEKNKQSLHMDLFSKHFIANKIEDVSNAIELWESIPKYFFTPKQMTKLRTENGQANPYVWEYKFRDSLGQIKERTVKIQPALIQQKDGQYKAFFPSATEELVEEALKKIFIQQTHGIHDEKNNESWVRFSLRMIHKDLKSKKKERNISQLKHAIEIMSSCVITVSQEGHEIYRGAILSDLIRVERKKYLEDGNAHWIARLPVFISYGINQLQYRQFNYTRYMNCKEQATRWLYKQLINRFKQASFITDYHFLYSELAQNSGLFQMEHTQGNRRKVIFALDELKRIGIIDQYTTVVKKERKQIIDIKYTLYPSDSFISEQKAANKRDTHNKQKAQEMRQLNKTGVYNSE